MISKIQHFFYFYIFVSTVKSNVEVIHKKDIVEIFNLTKLNCSIGEIRIEEHEHIPLLYNCTEYATSKHNVSLDNKKIATLDVPNLPNYPEGTIFVRGKFLGYGNIKISLQQKNNNSDNDFQDQVISLAVTRKKSILDKLFIIFVTIMMALSYVGMGCAIDLKVVLEVLKKPVAPTIGFFCQYIIMPLTSYTAAYLMGLQGSIGLGFFAAGCAPGGGASNMYAYLLGGDASLSITMTVVSTLTALGMFPLWIYTLGSTIPGVVGTRFNIPFFNIVASLATMVIPLSIGALIKVKRPSWANILLRLLRPFFILIIIFLFTFGVWANLYIIYSITLKLVLSACALAYMGFILGALVSWACKQPLNRIIAIAIETGVQNTGLPILLLKFSLPQPEADLSIVAPVTVAMFMPIPLWIALIIIEGRKCVLKRRLKDKLPMLNDIEVEENLCSNNSNALPNGHAGEVKRVEGLESIVNHDPTSNRF